MRKSRGFLFCLYLVLIALTITQMPMQLSVFAEQNTYASRSRQLMVDGNRVVYADEPSKAIRLVGMNIPSLDWSATGENLYTSLAVACDDWGSNLIRLPVSETYWRGENNNNSDAYKQIVDKMVKAVASRGKYIIIDLHEYGQPDQQDLAFWQEVAQIYGNTPAVLFGLLNEPNGIDWNTWKNGNGGSGVGHQKLVEAIRDTGAKNILVAAGIDWGYQLRGLVNSDGTPSSYFLADQGSHGDVTKKGNGIMYDSHVYPWKGSRDENVSVIRRLAPLLIGENGWENTDPNDKAVSPNHVYWAEDFFNWVDDTETYGAAANWTGWCFHPTSTPRVLEDWNYNPTAYWGVYAKEKLLSYGMVNKPEAVNLINSFSPDMFEKYTLTKDGTAAVLDKTVFDGSVKFTFNRPVDGTQSIIKMAPSVYWDVSGMQRLQFMLEADQQAIGNSLTVGIEDLDGELWAKELTINDTNNNLIDLPVSDLTKVTTAKGDGIIGRAIKNIYLSINKQGSGEFTIRDVVINRGGFNLPAEFPPAPLNQTVEYVNDFCPDRFGTAQITGKASYAATRDDYDVAPCGLLSFAGNGMVALPVPAEWETESTSYIRFISKYPGEAHPDITLTIKTADGEYQTVHRYSALMNYNEISLGGLGIAGRKIESICFSSSEPCSLEIRDVTFTSIKPPVTSIYQPVNTSFKVDFESDAASLRIRQKSNGNKTGDYFKGEILDGIGIGGSKAFKVSFKRASDSNGGYLFCDFPSMSVQDARYFSYMIKNNGEGKNVSLTLEDTSGNKYLPSVSLKKYDDGWTQYTYDLREEMQTKRKGSIIRINFYNNSKGIESSYILDEMTFSGTIPQLAGRTLQKVFVNEFEDDPFTWSSDVGSEGYVGRGRLLKFSESSVVTAAIPSGWGYFEQTQYITFMAKSDSDAQVKVSLNKSGKTLASFNSSVSSDWRRIICPIMDDSGLISLFGTDQVAFSSADGKDIIIDDLTFSQFKPLKTGLDQKTVLDYTDVNLMIHDDFEYAAVNINGSTATVTQDGENIWTAKKGSDFSNGYAFRLNQGMVFRNSSLNYLNETNYITTHKDLLNANGGLTVTRNFGTLTGADGLVAVEFRVFYPSTDFIDFTLMEKPDGTGTTLAKFDIDKTGNMKYGEYYNTAGSKVTASTEQSLPSGQWAYLRAVLDLTKSRVKLYYGFNPYNMRPFNSAVEDYPLHYNTLVNKLSSLKITGKGSLNVDDLKVYTFTQSSAPVAENVKIEGSPQVGGILTGSYEYHDNDGDTENGTVIEWQSADDPEFTKKLSVLQAGGLTYILTEAERGKYIRMTVTPKNEAALKPIGAEASVTTQLKVGSFVFHDMKILKNGEQVYTAEGGGIFKGNCLLDNYSGRTVGGIAVIARYKNNTLIECKLTSFEALPQELPAIIETPELAVENGVTGETIKMLVWDGKETISPYADVYNTE